MALPLASVVLHHGEILSVCLEGLSDVMLDACRSCPVLDSSSELLDTWMMATLGQNPMPPPFSGQNFKLVLRGCSSSRILSGILGWFPWGVATSMGAPVAQSHTGCVAVWCAVPS